MRPGHPYASGMRRSGGLPLLPRYSSVGSATSAAASGPCSSRTAKPSSFRTGTFNCIALSYFERLPARRRVGCGSARRRRAVVGQARPDRDRRQQAGRRHDHRRQLRAGGQGRLSHADAVELGTALDRALPVRQAALRPDQGLFPRRLHRLGRQRLRRAACRAGQDHAGADRLDQKPGQAGAVRLGRPGLDRPHHRRDVQGRARARTWSTSAIAAPRRCSRT